MPDDPQPAPGTAGPPPSGRWPVWKRIAVIALAIGVLVAGGGFAAWRIADARINANVERLGDVFADLPDRPPTSAPRTTATPSPSASDGATPVAEEAPEPAEQAAHPPVNILLLGSDSRISAGDPEQWQAGAQRTDAILLLHIPSDRERAMIMSVPRDSWVSIPGHGNAKINAAFSYGGPSLMVRTFEQLTGIRLDHVVVTDFDSFSRLTDHFGHVDITIPTTTYDRRRRETIPAGTYEMNGAEALDYVRQRYGLARGDFDRVERHQDWMRAIMARATELGVRDDPVKLTQTLLVISELIAADDDFTVTRMRELAMTTRPIDEAKDVTTFTAPHNGTGWSPDGKQSIVVLNRERLAAVSAAIAADNLGQFLADHPGYLREGEYLR